jgi:hypothetical protein
LHWNFGSYSKPYEVTASKKSTPAPRPEKSSGDTKAEGELLMSFPQGWSLYKTTINKTGTDGKPLKLVVYNLNKTKELKNIPYDKFLEFKGEMLTSLNMKWGKFQKFEKWTFPVDTDILKVIIEKYYGVGQPKEETPTPQPTPSAEKQSFNVGDKFLMTRTGETFTIDFMVDDNYGIVYFDGLTGNLTKSALQVGLDSGYYKRVVDEEKEEVGNEEEVKKAIAALEILADDGDEDAKKGIEALKILLN